MSDGLKSLVIGSGSIAKRHIRNLKRMVPQGLVACVSSSGRMLAEGETEADHLIADLQTALSWQPDMAVVASPAPKHIEHAVELLRNRVPVLIEKPLSDELAKFVKAEEFFSINKDKIQVAYNIRFLSSAKAMKDLIDRQILGHLCSISIDVGQYLPDWRPATDYRSNVSAQKALGGGVLLELSHEFDYLTWIFGHFDRVYCLTSQSGLLEIDVEDSVDALFSRDNGLTAHLHMDFLQRKATRVCKVIGENGNLVWDLIENSITLQSSSETKKLFSDPAGDRNDMYIEQLQDFIRVVKGEAAPSIGLDDGLYILKLVEMMRLSVSTRAPISIGGL